MGDASAVLLDYALTQGIDATPRDIALWMSGFDGPLQVLGAEALAESAAPYLRPRWCSRSGSRSTQW